MKINPTFVFNIDLQSIWTLKHATIRLLGELKPQWSTRYQKNPSTNDIWTSEECRKWRGLLWEWCFCGYSSSLVLWFWSLSMVNDNVTSHLRMYSNNPWYRWGHSREHNKFIVMRVWSPEVTILAGLAPAEGWEGSIPGLSLGLCRCMTVSKFPIMIKISIILH